MILNNFYRKLNKNEYFPKKIDSIDFLDYKNKFNRGTYLNRKIKKNELKSLKLESFKDIDTNKDCKKVFILDENEKKNREKRKFNKRVKDKEPNLCLDSALNCPEYDKFEDLKTNRPLNRNHLFTAMTIGAKLASKTSYFNLKSPINYDLKKNDTFKLPRLIENENKPFNLNRMIQKNELSNLSKQTLDEENFSLPIITSKRKLQANKHLCLKSEKVFLVDKKKLLNEDFGDFEFNKKNLMDNLGDNHFSKQSIDIFIKNKNRKKENLLELAEDNVLGKNSKVKEEKHRFSPSIKFSEVDEKMYLKIFIPTVN